MVLYIPRSIFHLAQLLYVRPENFGPSLIQLLAKKLTVPTGVSAFTHSIKINNGLVIRLLVKKDMAASFMPFLIHLSQFYICQS